MILFRRSSLLPLALLLAAPPALVSQTYRGGVAGTITDATGAVVAGAKVTLLSTETGVTRETDTTGAGAYVFQDLQVGTYSVTVMATGFGELKLSSIEVSPGAVTAANGRLAVGSSSVVVEVSTDATTQIQTLSTANNAVIPEKAVSEIPLNGRSFTQLLQLTPGYNASGSLNGSRSNQINYQIDGADNNDIFQGGTAANQGGVGSIAGVTLPIESIDQFSVQSSGAAEEGHSAGGVVSLALKTGTNNFHGTGYFYGRSEFFAARDFFALDTARKQKVRNQQFGGSIGGPIMKDKLFFYTNYERQKYMIQLSSSSATEPGAAYVAQATALLARHGLAVNPLSTTLLNALYPGGNAPGLTTSTGNYLETHQREGYSDNFVGNLNFIMTPKQTVRLQAFVGTGRQAEPGGPTYPYFQVAPDITQSFSLSHNWAPTERLSNQIILATGIFNQTFNDLNHSFNLPALGLNTGVTAPALLGAPTITMTGFDTVGSTQPLGRKDYTGHVSDSATYVKGRHQIRFGGEFRRSYIDMQYQANTRGSFGFTGYGSRNLTLPTGTTAYSNSSTTAQVCGTPGVTAAAQCGGVNDYNFITTHSEVLALADFLRGDYSSGSFTQGNLRRDTYRTDLAFFIQDQFKATPKLVLNFGLRHDYFGSISSNGAFSVWRPGVAGTDGNGLLGVGMSGTPSVYHASKLNFSPKVGLAYTVSSRQVLRASYGLYPDAPPFNGFLNNGQIATVAAATGLQANPYAGVAQVAIANNIWQTGVPVFASAAGASSYGLFSVNPNLKTAYSQTFNLSTEFQISSRTVATLGYAGSTGTHLYSLRDANQPAYWTSTAPGNTGGVLSTGALATATTATNACALVTNVANAACLLQRRPSFLNKSITNFANVATVMEVYSQGASNYNSLQATIKSNGWHGITSQLSYTLAHSLDNGSAFRSTGPTDSNNLRLDYGNASFDIRHTLNGYLVYELPQIGHRFSALTKGWQATLLSNIRSATPFTITTGDTTGIGMGRDRINYNGGDYKSGSTTIQTEAGTGRKFVQYFNLASAGTILTNSANGTRGNTSRNFFRGPNFYQIDTALAKNTKIYEGINFQFRADLFNIFNIVNPGNPTTSLTSATFGQQTSAPTGISAGAPFNVQFAGKIIF